MKQQQQKTPIWRAYTLSKLIRFSVYVKWNYYSRAKDKISECILTFQGPWNKHINKNKIGFLTLQKCILFKTVKRTGIKNEWWFFVNDDFQKATLKIVDFSTILSTNLLEKLNRQVSSWIYRSSIMQEKYWFLRNTPFVLHRNRRSAVTNMLPFNYSIKRMRSIYLLAFDDANYRNLSFCSVWFRSKSFHYFSHLYNSIWSFQKEFQHSN